MLLHTARMRRTWISQLGHALPAHRLTQEQSLDWLSERLAPGTDITRLQRWGRRCGITARHSVLDVQNGEGDALYPRTGQAVSAGTAERMALYAEHAPALAMAAIRAACPDGVGRITHVIAVSCTGLMAPGLETILALRLSLPTDTVRTGIHFQGCHAGVTALRCAHDIVLAHPQARVLIVCCELCSLHLQPGPGDDALLGACLFADGAAAAVVEGGPDPVGRGIAIHAHRSALIADSAQDMAWRVGDRGFTLALSPRIAQALGPDLPPLVDALLAGDVDRTEVTWLVHPGGPRILEAVRRTLRLDAEHLTHSWAGLAEAGNRSSGTILAILDAATQAKNSGMHGLLAFGPGLTAEALLVELPRVPAERSAEVQHAPSEAATVGWG